MYFFVFIWWLVSFGVCIYMQYFFDVVRNKSKQEVSTSVNQEKIKSYIMWTCFKFWPIKNVSKTNKPIRVWLWLLYKFNENNCCLRLFSKFIQAQKIFPNSIEKISILTWKPLVISIQNFSCELNSTKTYS